MAVSGKGEGLHRADRTKTHGLVGLVDAVPAARVKTVYSSLNFRFNGGMDDSLAYSVPFIRNIFDTLSAHIAIIDDTGRILETNAAWKQFAREGGAPESFDARGMNYLSICEAARGDGAGDAASVAAGIRKVIAGELHEFLYDYPCHSPEGRQWFYMRALRMEDGGMLRVIVSHEDITELKLAQEALKDQQEVLAERNLSLEEANTALRVLIRQREEDRAEQEQKFLSHIQTFVLPYVRRLKTGCSLRERDLTLLDIVESQLNEVVSPLMTRLSAMNVVLTPQEIQVASLVREGRTTAEIADLLFISEATVSFHRKNIRRKLGLSGRGDNLRSFLLSMS